MIKIQLAKPIQIDGNEVKELTFDFENLKGRDAIQAEAEAKLLGAKFAVPELDKTYNAVLAAKVLKMSADDILDMPLKDFTAVTVTVQNFLLGGESKEEASSNAN